MYDGKYKQNNLNIVGKINQFPDQFPLLKHKLPFPEDFNTCFLRIFFVISADFQVIARKDPELVRICSVK